MKDYIFNRIQRAEMQIRQELRQARTTPAYKLDYKKSYINVMRHCSIKSFPRKYKDEISAILWFCWRKDVLDHIVYPTIYNGKLYNAKWDDLPEEVREFKRTEKKIPYVRMWPDHLTEGMNVPEDAKILT